MRASLRRRLLTWLDQSHALDRLTALLSPLLRLYLHGPRRVEYFRQWERAGLHLTPVHFYQPIPDTRALPASLWARPSAMVGVDMREAQQLDWLERVFPQYQPEYSQLPHGPTDRPDEFYMYNEMFGWADALVYYCLVRHFRPRAIVEVGAGMSTRLAAQALRRNGEGAVVCIEPYPDPALAAGFPGLARLIQQPVQTVGLDVFEALEANDILFIDSSHVVACGSDVNYLVLEVLPRLKPGVLVHFHDIFLPAEFPEDWVKNKLLFWNEQYLVHAFLMFNPAFEIVFANAFMTERHPAAMQAAFGFYWPGGGSLWLRRRLPETPSPDRTF